MAVWRTKSMKWLGVAAVLGAVASFIGTSVAATGPGLDQPPLKGPRLEAKTADLEFPGDSLQRGKLSDLQASGKQRAGVVPVASVRALARVNQMHRPRVGPPSYPVLFNAIDGAPELVPAGDGVEVFVMPLYGLDRATDDVVLVDGDARLEDVDPASGLVLVRSVLAETRLRILDLNLQREVGSIPVDAEATGTFSGADSVVISSGDELIHWVPTTDEATTLTTLSQIGLTAPTYQMAGSGTKVALVDAPGHLAVIDLATGEVRQMSDTADGSAAPAMWWEGDALYWADNNYSEKRFAIGGYDFAADQPYLVETPKNYLTLGISSYPLGGRRVVYSEAMLGTGAPFSTLFADDPTDGTVSDRLRIDLVRPDRWIFSQVISYERGDGNLLELDNQLLVVLTDTEMDREELWLVELEVPLPLP